MVKGSVVLIGFMGMGKSTVGPRAAEELAVGYYDTDDWMEAETGVDVPALVKSDMAQFRRLEAEALRTILGNYEGVVSTGGGIVSTELGRAALLGSGVPVVWLRAPFDIAVSRVMVDSGRERPLFADVESARKLFDERQKWYEEVATNVVDASRPIEIVAERIVSILRP